MIGRTFHGKVVCDIKTPKSGPAPNSSAYVQLSRIKRLDQLFLLRDFTVEEMNNALDPRLVAEVEWQRRMAIITSEEYS
jgi:hypothetical protein